MFYISTILFAVFTCFFYDPVIVGYTISAGVLVVWEFGLAIFEYIGKKHDVILTKIHK